MGVLPHHDPSPPVLRSLWTAEVSAASFHDPDWSIYAGIKLPSLDALEQALAPLGNPAKLAAERDLLADLLDGVMQDDPQAIRDAAAWLATNRPEQETA